MACKYKGNMLIYRLLKLTFFCVYGMQIGLRSTVYQHIFSFPKQASPVQFVWNPESEALFLSFSTVQDNRNWVPDQKKFKQQKRWQWQNPDNTHVQQIIFLVQQEKLTGRFLARTMKFDLHWIFRLDFLSSSEAWWDIPSFPNQGWVLRSLSKLFKMFWVDTRVLLLICTTSNKMSFSQCLCY